MRSVEKAGEGTEAEKLFSLAFPLFVKDGREQTVFGQPFQGARNIFAIGANVMLAHMSKTQILGEVFFNFSHVGVMLGEVALGASGEGNAIPRQNRLPG